MLVEQIGARILAASTVLLSNNIALEGEGGPFQQTVLQHFEANCSPYFRTERLKNNFFLKLGGGGEESVEYPCCCLCFSLFKFKYLKGKFLCNLSSNSVALQVAIVC